MSTYQRENANPNPFSVVYVTREIPRDIDDLKASLEELKDIYNPVILDKYAVLTPSDRLSSTRIMNKVLVAFKDQWGFRWDDSFSSDTYCDYQSLARDAFPQAVQDLWNNHLSMKETHLIELLNQSLLSLVQQRSYLSDPADLFLTGDTPQNRMANWLDLSQENRLRISANSLQVMHNADLDEVTRLINSKWRRAWGSAVVNISHMRRLYSQISLASNRVVKRKLDLPAPGRLVKQGSNVSSDSASRLERELDLLRDSTKSAAINLATHCGINIEGKSARLDSWPEWLINTTLLQTWISAMKKLQSRQRHPQEKTASDSNNVMPADCSCYNI